MRADRGDLAAQAERIIEGIDGGVAAHGGGAALSEALALQGVHRLADLLDYVQKGPCHREGGESGGPLSPRHVHKAPSSRGVSPAAPKMLMWTRSGVIASPAVMSWA
jgi:hypothetical protein